jgi:hypothetical protein
MAAPIVQILTPLYNEERCFELYIEAVERVLISRADAEYRCLLVDDGLINTTGGFGLSRGRREASRAFRRAS